MENVERIVYSLCVEDIQRVAREELGRELNEMEVGVIEREVGEYIDWYGAIHVAIINAGMVEPEGAA
jgi:hypothetical protein